jgi:hypothetical protein
MEGEWLGRYHSRKGINTNNNDQNNTNSENKLQNNILSPIHDDIIYSALVSCFLFNNSNNFFFM